MDISLSPLQLVISLICALSAAYFGFKRNKNPYIWFFVGFFFGMLGLFFLLFLPKMRRKPNQVIPSGPIFRGPSDKLWFYLNPEHEQIGPVSSKAIHDALNQGTISQNTYVWHEDLSEWKRAKEFIY